MSLAFFGSENACIRFRGTDKTGITVSLEKRFFGFPSTPNTIDGMLIPQRNPSSNPIIYVKLFLPYI
jgi:hypothetical protein